MKKILIGMLLISSLVFAQGKKTVQDYWKAVANKTDVTNSSVSIDLKNDYISYSGNWEGNGEFAVWRKKNGIDLIGETRTGCGPACMTTHLQFLEPKGSKFVDVTAKVLPKMTQAQEKQLVTTYNRKTGENFTLEQISYYFKFPRKGTSLTVRSGEGSDSDTVLAEYKFNGANFVFVLAN